ncbi:MAG: hypothetical protein LHW57_02845 [Candidatus Cloacimonetes bacterium]|jgi:hypothetical protein|nr:hypothetical protein [Candidatus Cloacimonadota bacterium]
MAGLTIRKLLPAFFPVAMEIFRHFKRDFSHNNNIKKFNESEEKLATIENLIVKVEKKALINREEIRAFKTQFVVWAVINSALLIAIFVKLFFL